MESNRLFFHVHIPKCGGTTLRRVLKRNFRSGFLRDPRPATGAQYTREEAAAFVTAHPRLRCYSSHNLSLNLPFDLNDSDVHAITFVRDPVRRFLSHYFYHRNNLADSPVKEARTLNLSEYVEHALAQGNQRSYINGQVWFLNGQTDEGLAPIRELLDAGRTLIFPLERFDDACLILERRFPQDFRNCAYARANVSTKDQQVDDAVLARIEEFVQLDRELQILANTWVDAQLKTLFNSEEALSTARAEFAKRCAGRLDLKLEEWLRAKARKILG